MPLPMDRRQPMELDRGYRWGENGMHAVRESLKYISIHSVVRMPNGPPCQSSGVGTTQENVEYVPMNRTVTCASSYENFLPGSDLRPVPLIGLLQRNSPALPGFV